MNRSLIRLTTTFLAGSLLSTAFPGFARANVPAVPRAAPTSGIGAPMPPESPALQQFADAVTFYHSFDQFPTADLSAGDGASTNPAASGTLVKGLFGQAFLSGKSSITFNAAGSIDLKKPGSLLVWISPYHWKSLAEPPYLFFVNILSQGMQLMLARMGNRANEQKIYAYAQSGGNSFSLIAGDSLGWKDSEWHLLALNWRSDSLEFSLDGGELHRHTAPWLSTTQGDPGLLIVGSEGQPDQQYLIDDLMILDRPLSGEEIGWTFRQRGGVHP